MPDAADHNAATPPTVHMGAGTAAAAAAAGGDACLGWTDVYFDQGEQGYDEADEGLPLPKLNDDANDLAPFIPADKAAVLCALQMMGAPAPGTPCAQRSTLSKFRTRAMHFERDCTRFEPSRPAICLRQIFLGLSRRRGNLQRYDGGILHS